MNSYERNEEKLTLMKYVFTVIGCLITITFLVFAIFITLSVYETPRIMFHLAAIAGTVVGTVALGGITYVVYSIFDYMLNTHKEDNEFAVAQEVKEEALVAKAAVAPTKVEVKKVVATPAPVKAKKVVKAKKAKKKK